MQRISTTSSPSSLRTLHLQKRRITTSERTPPDGDTYNHLLVLAQNERATANLVKITSEASLHGFYYKPRVSKNFLAEHSRGLIGLSGCLKGEVAERLTEGKYDAALAAAGTYRDIFGKDNFYLEIQDQGLAMEAQNPSRPLPVGKDLGLPLVATTTATICARTTLTPRRNALHPDRKIHPRTRRG